jgi:hypothetical protein
MESVASIEEIDDLRHRLDYLTLVTEALWSFLLEQGHTEAELIDRINAIDLSDGRLDSRHVHRVTCANCGAAVTTDHCQFCGAHIQDVFATV